MVCRSLTQLIRIVNIGLFFGLATTAFFGAYFLVLPFCIIGFLLNVGFAGSDIRKDSSLSGPKEAVSLQVPVDGDAIMEDLGREAERRRVVEKFERN